MNIEVTLSLGTNCGNRNKAIADASAFLRGIIPDIVISDTYTTETVGNGPSATYLNAVARGHYSPSISRGIADLSVFVSNAVQQLDSVLKEYELTAGRDNNARCRGLVPIDIDIITANGVILRPKDACRQYYLKGITALDSE